jgi:hypothetical protein
LVTEGSFPGFEDGARALLRAAAMKTTENGIKKVTAGAVNRSAVWVDLVIHQVAE